jgi:hypothetical protein
MNSELNKIRDEMAAQYQNNVFASDNPNRDGNSYIAGFDAAVAIMTARADEILVQALAHYAIYGKGTCYCSCGNEIPIFPQGIAAKNAVEQWKEFVGTDAV